MFDFLIDIVPRDDGDPGTGTGMGNGNETGGRPGDLSANEAAGLGGEAGEGMVAQEEEEGEGDGEGNELYNEYVDSDG
jgi:hypothetical protein